MMADERALFWKLTEAEHLKARAFCRKLIGNREDGDDLYHDVLVAALLRFPQLRDRSAFRPWLYRIVVNTFKNRVRRPWWKWLTPLSKEIEDRVAGPNPDAGQSARRRLEWAFRAVTPEERTLVTLHELEGWRIVELAELFGKNEAAVKMQLSRARRKMREAIAERIRRPNSVPARPTANSKESVCVAVRPSED